VHGDFFGAYCARKWTVFEGFGASEARFRAEKNYLSSCLLYAALMSEMQRQKSPKWN